jgi:hypothetical protein
MAGLVALGAFCAIGSAFLLWALVQIEHDLKRQERFNRRGQTVVTRIVMVHPNISDTDGMSVSHKNRA